jgi:hypothetical protein
MIDFDDLTAEDLDCLGLRCSTPGSREFDEWFRDLNAKADAEIAAEHARLNRLLQAAEAKRRAAEERRQRREAIALVTEAQKIGIGIKRYTIDGVTLEFGQPAAEAPPEPSSVEPSRRALFKARLIPKQKVVL